MDPADGLRILLETTLPQLRVGFFRPDLYTLRGLALLSEADKLVQEGVLVHREGALIPAGEPFIVGLILEMGLPFPYLMERLRLAGHTQTSSE